MRRGSIYRRCTSCGRRVPDRKCENCGSDRFSWAYTIDTAPKGAKRKQRSKSGFGTKDEAVSKLAKIQADIDSRSYVEPRRLTVETYLTEEWLSAMGARLRPSTWDSYRSKIVTHINPRIGKVRLQAVTPGTLNAMYDGLLKEGRVDERGGLSPRTVRYIHTILRKAFRDAVRWNLMVRNPADYADPPKSAMSGSRELTVWTADELRRFLLSVEDHRLYAAWLLAATTGLRRGELAGLRWEDVDLDNRRVSVRRSRVLVRHNVELQAPKTARGRRQISLDPTTVAILKEHRRRQLEERMALGQEWRDTGYLFTTEGGQPVRPDRFSKLFQRLQSEADVPRIRLHDLRHTHASLMLQAGIHPKVVSERLGHATVQLTLDTYSHVIPALQEDAADRVAELLFG
ncbi:MAG: tyrosine-type recombinase/integrase [Acidimicrobiia bacterium]